MQVALHPLDLVVRELGGRGALAAALGVSLAALGNWKSRGVPIQRCVAIERLSGGVVTRRDLRPDDWRDIWPELAESEEKSTPAPASQAQAAINSEARQQA